MACFPGNQKEVTSNGFLVDGSPPVVGTVPHLLPGAGSLDDAGVVSRDMLAVRWALSDPVSHVAAQYLSLHSHLSGEFQPTPVQVGPQYLSLYSHLSGEFQPTPVQVGPQYLSLHSHLSGELQPTPVQVGPQHLSLCSHISGEFQPTPVHVGYYSTCNSRFTPLW